MGSLHPAIVHIPIGALVLYSLVELGLLFFKSYRKRMDLGKYIMLLFGVIGGFFALQSGDDLEGTFGDGQLLDLHESFADATMWVYGILLVVFSIQLINSNKAISRILRKNEYVDLLWRLILSISKIITRPSFLAILAVAGLVILSITGALGGALAHGPDSDPVVSMIYSLFF